MYDDFQAWQEEQAYFAEMEARAADDEYQQYIVYCYEMDMENEFYNTDYDVPWQAYIAPLSEDDYIPF